MDPSVNLNQIPRGFSVIGGGLTGEAFRSTNWENHPLGPPEKWHAALKFSLNLVFHSTQPMLIWWGAEFYQFFNDAYSPSLEKNGVRPFQGEGGPSRWQKAWPQLVPQIDSVLKLSAATWDRRSLSSLLQSENLESIYGRCILSPILNDHQNVEGILVTCLETTTKMSSRHSLNEANQYAEAERLRLERMFRQSPTPLAMLQGPDHRFFFANEIYEKFFLNTPDYLGKTVAELLPDAEAQGFIKLLDEVYQSGQPYRGTETLFSVSGPNHTRREFFLNFVYEPVFTPEGTVEGVLAAISDVTEQVITRKKLEAAMITLETDRHRFSTIFADAATSMAITKGPTHIFEYANPSYLSLFEGRDLLGKAILDALPELKGQPFPELFERVFKSGQPYVEREALAYLRRSAKAPLEERYFDQTYTRLSGSDGQPYGVFIHAFEVTERVFARRRIQESESQLRLATETARLGAWSYNLETKIYTWSSRAAEIYGLPGTETVTLAQLKERIHPEDQHVLDQDFKLLLNPLAAAEVQREHRIIWPDGRIRWIQVSAAAAWGNTAEGRKVLKVVGTILDLTDRLETQIELRKAKEAAENANAAKSAFLANMSHEIRTPLGAIMGFVDLIKDEKLSRQTLDNYLVIIDRNSHQLLRIIDDILDLSKVEAGMMLIEAIEFSLVELLADFSSLMGFRARDKGIIFSLKAKSALPDVIISDPTRLRQILTNIVGNAIKFTERGQVQLSVSYEKDMVSFEIQDTGPGISKEQEAALFLPFSQADVSITRKFGGTGLGLVLTRRLTEALGGLFRLKESQVDVGSTFTASIKVSIPSHAKMVSALGYTPVGASTHLAMGRLNGLRILLVEDSPDNQVLISIILRRTGAFVDIAADGAQGVEVAMRSHYDVILMDVQMPVMDGLTAVKLLREKGYVRPIIALTAHAMKEEKDRCIKAGFNEFLSKPVQREELFHVLSLIHAQVQKS